MRLPLLLLALGGLAACREDTPAPRAAAPAEDARPLAARAAAEAALRARLRMPEEPQWRGVQVFAQAVPGTYAVCGRTAPARGPGEAFIPWVATVTVQNEPAQVAELVVGTSGAEATRVFAELVDRCFEGGGPPSARAAARPLPPLPEAVPAAPLVAVAAPALDAGADPARRLAQRSITTTARHGANIRSAPRGGEVVRVAPRASVLEVYDIAPGGWLQVGLDGEPWGWMHTSLVEGGAP